VIAYALLDEMKMDDMDDLQGHWQPVWLAIRPILATAGFFLYLMNGL